MHLCLRAIAKEIEELALSSTLESKAISKLAWKREKERKRGRGRGSIEIYARKPVDSGTDEAPRIDSTR